MIWIISAITFFISCVVVLGVWLLLQSESSQEIVRGRIEQLRAAQNWAGMAADLKLVRDNMYSTIPTLHRLFADAPGAIRAQQYLSQAGMKTKPAKIFLLCVVTAIVTYFIAGVYLPYYFAMGAGVATFFIPVAYVSFARRKRLQKFEERFPDALDMLGRAARAGHAFTAAMQLVAQDSAEPVAGEFAITFEEQNYGIPLRDAMEHFADRVPLFDVRFLVTALNVQKDSGGNLAEVLDQLSRVIRERFRIQRDVKSKTALGRLTAGILIMLPIAMLGMMMLVNPDYESIIFHDPEGPKILAIAAVMQLVGGLILWRIVKIEV